MSVALDACIILTSWTYVVLAPYTKVEESFNLHAVHDHLMYGVGPSSLPNYDHYTFPGAVPRTFIGSVLLAWMSQPVIHLLNRFGIITSKFDMQIIVRLVLATLNAIGLCLIRRGVSRRFGRPTGLFYTIVTCSQFHLPFWMGRTLPNMFALFPVNVAVYLLVDRAPNANKPSQTSVGASIALTVFAAVVFRAELAVLGAALALQAVFLGYMSFRRVFLVGLLSSAISIGCTVGVDSYFWGQPWLWPEWQSIYFNVVEGKSEEWGTSPAHAYLTSHLPKLLLTALPLSVFSAFSSSPKRLLPLIFPSVVLVGAMSALGHKEWRFVVYAVPVWNIVAARGMSVMVSRRKSTLFGRFLFLAACGAICANIVATLLLASAASKNYPGGEAMDILNSRAQGKVHAHICNLALQTGASLFTHEHASPYPPYLVPSSQEWVYDKTDSPATYSRFTHLITEEPGRHKHLGSVKAFERWALDLPALKSGNVLARASGVLHLEKREKLWVSER